MSLSMLGLVAAAELIVEIADAETRKKVEVKNEKNQKVRRRGPVRWCAPLRMQR